MTDATTERLIRFLLGRLPISEREPLERALLREDSGAFAELLALEDELRFLYLNGQLSSADEQAFEIRHLSSVSDRARLVFARALQHLATARRRGGA